MKAMILFIEDAISKIEDDIQAILTTDSTMLKEDDNSPNNNFYRRIFHQNIDITK